MAKKSESQSRIAELEAAQAGFERARGVLEKAEWEKKTILNRLPEIVTYQDKEHRVLWTNRAGYESVGASQEDEELVGRYCYAIWAQSDERCADCPVARAMETGQPEEVEKTTPDGRMWFIRGYPVMDENGEIIGGIEVTQEVTVQKQSDQALRMTRASVERAPDSFFWFDADAHFTDVTERTCEVLGYTRQELLDMTVFDVDPDFPPEAWPGLQEQIKQTGAVTLESRHRTKDGRVFPVNVTVSHLDFGDVERYFSIAQDITERKLAQETLRKNEERLELAMKASNAGVWEFWPQDDKAFFDERWFTMLGYEPGELEHSYATWRSLLHPDDVASIERVVFAAVEKGSEFVLDIRMRAKNGEWHWIHDIGQTVEWTEEGAAKRMIGTHTDITEQKQAEQALRTTRASVDQARDAFYWFDEEAHFIDVNETTLEMLGYTREEILALSVFDVDPTFPREAWPPLKEQLKEKGSLAFEGVNQTKDGVIIPVDVVVSYLQFGEREIYFSIARDITEQKRAQEEREQLQQEIIEAQQQALKELSTPVIPIIDAPGGGGGVIVMPLIGSIDTMRARDITRRLLAGIRQHRAKVVILDVTGVPVVDSGVANHLNKTVQAARLKGARTIVTGISDAVAETIVDLGIDWSGIETLADLQTGLIVALKSIGVGLRRVE